DVLSLRHGKRPSRAAAECWSNPSARQQHSANTAVRLVKSAPNLMQRLSCLPAAPNVTLLDRRKPKPHPSSHANTTFTEQIYIRWCCIDLSNAPGESALGALWVPRRIPFGTVKAEFFRSLPTLSTVAPFLFELRKPQKVQRA